MQNYRILGAPNFFQETFIQKRRFSTFFTLFTSFCNFYEISKRFKSSNKRNSINISVRRHFAIDFFKINNARTKILPISMAMDLTVGRLYQLP